MLAGHFGLAAVVKSRQPQVPLWALMLATQLLDVVFAVLYLLKVESLGPVAGSDGNYGDLLGTDITWSHSLVSALGISLGAAIIASIFWGRRSGGIIGVMVLSHWALDLLVHRPDLAILPGNAGNLPLFGLGLWQIPWIVFIIELALVLVGAYLYYHAAMRSAVRAERQEGKGNPAHATALTTPKASTGLRQQALVASLVMAVLLLGTLIADVLVPYMTFGG